MKKYIISVRSTTGATCYIGAQTDSTKPIYIYYCGQDTGKRYVNIGSASRYLAKLCETWNAAGILDRHTIGNAKNIPVYGCSEWNKALFRYYYCGEPFPNPRQYL